jgi:hypothetical protein
VAYAAEQLLLQETFFKTQNPWLINESSFKLRVAYDGARMVNKSAKHGDAIFCRSDI